MEKLIESVQNFEQSTSLLIEPERKWFDNKSKNEPSEFAKINNLHHLNALKDYAKKLYEQDLKNYQTFREKTRRSDHNWIKTVLRTGTIGDKINANCILVQDSALHNLSSVEHLISSVKLTKKRECILAMDALRDLFVNYLLPNAPLKNFHEHPFEFLSPGDKTARDKHLLLWYFESLLKFQYLNFVKAVQATFQDPVAATKFKAASTLFSLITANQSENNRVVIEVLVNKLGDPDYKVASRIIYDIKTYLTNCPKMKMNVLVELERLVSRQNINQRAQYYGFCCMNQYLLSKQDSDVANRLLIIYFSFFKKFVKDKEVDSRMLSALLTGVNRCYKFAKMNNEELDKNLNTLFKLVHVTSFSVSLQALMLLSQVADSRDDMLHRYFNALYRKMFDLEWRNTSKQTFFLNLVYNSVVKDEATPRIKAFVKRLLQVSFSQGAPFVCGSLMLVSELIKAKKDVFELECGVLVNSAKEADEKFGEDEEERFYDVKSDEENEEEKKKKKKSEETNGSAKRKNASWVHKKNLVFKRHDHYDYQERNPLYCGADKTMTFELLPLTRHYHPSVVVFANKLLNKETIDYAGDPMEDFTIIHFLDRFVYKNPKKTKTKKEKPIKKSVFEPVKSMQRSNIKNIPVNSKEYLNLDKKAIPEEEKFFYEYYKMKANKKQEVELESDGSVSDTDFDEYLMKTEQDGADGKDDLDLDFADGLSKKSKKEMKKKKESDEESDAELDEDDLDDDEDDEEFEKEMLGEMDGEEDFDFNNDEDFDKETGLIKIGKKSNNKKDISELFAAADEFTDLINESAKYEEMGVGGLSNKDNADPKQLRWEMKRDRKQQFGQKKKGRNFSKSNKPKNKSSSNKNKKK